jgi:uncharacterized membrane protein YbaN (DUF454 family)
MSLLAPVNVLRAPLLATLGTLALALGIVGIFVPLLPTTPFLLAAAACYARSSRRLHGWLLAHRHFGPSIRAFEEGALPPRAKALALASLWLSIAFLAFALPPVAAKAAALSVACGVTAWIVAMPTSGGALRQGR